MRIAHIAVASQVLPPKGDKGRWLLVTALIEEQVRRGHDVTVYSNAKTNIAGVETMSIDMLSKEQLVGPNTSAKMLTLYNNLLLLNKAYRHSTEYDILHSHLNNMHFFMSPLVDRPTLMTQHWPIEPITQELIKRTPYSNVYITPISHAQTRQQAERIQYTDVVYNGIDTEAFPFNPTPGNHFAFVGRMHPTKGVHHAIAASQALNAELRMAGFSNKKNDVYVEYWAKYIEPALSDPRITYHGELPHGDVPAFMSSAKALLVPIEWEEPFGLVIVEAMSTGTPVIAFNRGAAPELIKDGVTGFIVNNETELQAAMKKIDQIDRSACRAWVEQNFTTKRMADGYDAVYQQLVSQHGISH